MLIPNGTGPTIKYYGVGGSQGGTVGTWTNLSGGALGGEGGLYGGDKEGYPGTDGTVLVVAALLTPGDQDVVLTIPKTTGNETVTFEVR